MVDTRRDRVRALFGEAVALPPRERSEYLTAACGPDVSLRDEVESLLAYDEIGAAASADGFLLSPVIRQASPESEEKPPSIPGYEVIGLLGRGGMGTVYRARDLALQRTVALKVILAGGHLGTQGRTRFEAEAVAVARLQHPNIVQVYGVGCHEGVPYVALECVEGGTLAEKLKGGALPPRLAANLVGLLGKAMAMAHSRNIVHRDLKPANILLTEDGSPKVADFGLARLLDLETGQTNPGTVMGTPSYMSPEQAAGDVLGVGPAADVYALGAILFECLTGMPPFRGGSPLEILDQVRQRDSESIRIHNPRLPTDLDTICQKCLKKDPLQRYASADALAEDLRRWCAGEPIIARPVRALERAAKWVCRNPAVAVLVTAVAVSLVAGIGATTFFALESREHAAQSLQRADEASQQADRADREAAAARQSEQAALFQSRRAEGARHTLQIDQALRAWQKNDLNEAERILADVSQEFENAWETRHVRQVCSRTASVLRGHEGSVFCVALTDDGSRVASGGEDATVRIWETQNGQELLTLRGHTAGIRTVAFRPDSLRIASAGGKQGKSGEVKIWDVATGSALLTLQGHTDVVYTASFSPDGRRLVTAGRDRTVKVWNADTGALEHTLLGHTSLTIACFCDEGRRIASGGLDRTLRIWNTETGELVQVLKDSTLSIASIAFSRFDPRLVVVGPKNTLQVVSSLSGEVAQSLQGNPANTMGVTAGSGAQWTVALSRSSEITIQDGRTGTVRAVYQGHSKPVTAVASSRDGQQMVSASFDGTLRIWRLGLGQVRITFPHLSKPHSVLAFDPTDRRLLVAGSDLSLTAVDMDGASVEHSSKGNPGTLESVCLHRDGSRFAAGSVGGSIVILDAKDGHTIRTLIGHTRPITALAFSLDGRRIVSGGRDRMVKCWDADTGQEQWSRSESSNSVRALTFSDDGRHVAAIGEDRTITIWETATGTAINTMRVSGMVSQEPLSISPDHAVLAATGAADTIEGRDVGTGRPCWRLEGHSDDVNSVTFSPDAKRILTASNDGTVRLWDAATAQEKLTLRHPSGAVRSAIFSHGGERIAAIATDGTVSVWEATTESPVFR